MRTLLYGVVNIDGSTGRDYKDSSVEIIGKTGTGQIAEMVLIHLQSIRIPLLVWHLIVILK